MLIQDTLSQISKTSKQSSCHFPRLPVCLFGVSDAHYFFKIRFYLTKRFCRRYKETICHAGLMRREEDKIQLSTVIFPHQRARKFCIVEFNQVTLQESLSIRPDIFTLNNKRSNPICPSGLYGLQFVHCNALRKILYVCFVNEILDCEFSQARPFEPLALNYIVTILAPLIL